MKYRLQRIRKRNIHSRIRCMKINYKPISLSLQFSLHQVCHNDVFKIIFKLVKFSEHMLSNFVTNKRPSGNDELLETHSSCYLMVGMNLYFQ